MTIRGEVLPVGPPVQLEWQIGRTRDIEEVRLAAESGEHVVLIDVRRTGKSTVALGGIELLAHAGELVFVLDASENAEIGSGAVTLIEDAATRETIAGALAAISGRLSLVGASDPR